MSDVDFPARTECAWVRAICCLWFAWIGCLPQAARAQAIEAAEAHAYEPADYRNARFTLHTDLPEEDAKALLRRLDVTLKAASRLFGAEPNRPIESYVVARLDQWPSEEFTHPAARLLIGGVGGGSVSLGFDGDATARRKVTVFAAALPSIPEHEIVHAYCVQTFGPTGPTWFSEGIAEALANGPCRRSAVRCSDEAIKYLRAQEPRGIAEIIAGEEFTAPLAASLVTMLARHDERGGLSDVVSMEQWKEEQSAIVNTARLSYHWCWSVCHFLYQHPAYQQRFQLLARSYVAGHAAPFDEAFAPVRDQLDFEYRFFMERLEPGYRVDLCAWEWSDPSPEKSGGRQRSVKVLAPRGYQATGLRLRKGQRVSFEATGQWRVAESGEDVDADGDRAGNGRLEAVILDAGELSAPLELGRSGQFTAPAGGRLYLRCRDAWGALADNRGTIRVTLRPAE